MNNFRVMDEFGSYAQTVASRLVEQLREIEGIPDVRYRVEGDNVFVFDKLVSLLKQVELPLESTARKEALRAAALEALPRAYLRPVEAIEDWRILPEGYAIVKAGGKFILKNTALNSFIPAPASTLSQAHAMLADLLVGKNIPTESDNLIKSQGVKLNMKPAPYTVDSQLHVFNSYTYAFGNQVFEHIKNDDDEFDFDLDEARDFFDFSDAIDGAKGLATTDSKDLFREGFPLLNHEHYKSLVNHAAQWFLNTERAIDIVKNSLSTNESGHQISTLHNSLTHNPKAAWGLNEEQTAVAQLIRELYPELADLSDQDIYFAYGSFLLDVNYMKSFSACDVFRDEEFLLHLLGEEIQLNLPSDAALQDKVSVGAIAVYFLSKGLECDESISRSRRFSWITLKINRVIWDCKQAFDYVEKVNSQGGFITIGDKVFTLSDTFGMWRKIGGEGMTVTQKPSDFDYKTLQ